MAAAAGIRAGRAFVELGADDSKLRKTLQKVQQRMRAAGKSITRIGAGMAAAGGAALTPMIAAVSSFAKSGDELSKASDKTGASVESLSELRHAAQQSAVDFSTLTRSIGRQQMALADAAGGSKEAAAKFEGLGLSVASLMGMSPDKQFEMISEAISRIQDPAKRAKAAMDIFGKSGAELLPLMIGGAKGIESLRQEARDLGLQVSGEDAAAATKFGDTWANVKSTLGAIVFQVGAALAPTLTQLMEIVIPIITRVIQWVKENRRLVVIVAAIAAGVTAAGIALIGLGGTFTLLAAGIGAVITVGTTLASMFAALASPVMGVVAAIAGLAYAFFTLTETGADVIDWFSTEFKKLISIVFGAVQGMYDAIVAGELGLAAEIAFTAVKLAIATVMDSVVKIFGSSIEAMMQMLAALFKRIKAFQFQGMKGFLYLSEIAQGIFGDQSREARQARQAGYDILAGQIDQQRRDWEEWDSDAAGAEWAKSFDPEALAKKLKELEAKAKDRRTEVEFEAMMAERAKERKFDLEEWDFTKSIPEKQKKGETFGTFSAALAGRMGGDTVQKQQLDQLRRIERNTKAKDAKARATS
jgi:hypothetical protein